MCHLIPLDRTVGIRGDLSSVYLVNITLAIYDLDRIDGAFEKYDAR